MNTFRERKISLKRVGNAGARRGVRNAGAASADPW